MNLLRASLIVLLFVTFTVAAEPVRVIFDTDFMTDCDDPGALGLLHALADRGECEILATYCSGLNTWSVPAIVAVNTYYGRGSLPVAAVKGSGVNMPSAYAQPLAERFSIVSTEVPDALPAYRKLLAAQKDRSVVLLTVGYATNIKNLLNSKPDEISPLSGRELAAAKVVRWVNMGGNFERRPGIDTSNVNWTRDTASAVAAIEAWPTEIVFCGREVGHSLRAGARLSETSTNNPVRVAYELYFKGPAKDRHCADLYSVLFAVRNVGPRDKPYWALESGRIEMRPDASFTWTPGAKGPRAEWHLIDASVRPEAGLLQPAAVQELIEDLMIQLPAVAK